MVDLKLIFIFAIIPFLVCEEVPIPDVGKYPPSFLKNGQIGLFLNKTEKAVGQSIEFSSLSGKYPSSFKNNGQRALGITAKKGEFPFQVLLKLDGYFKCGGTLISNRFVLTAAHCVDDYFFEATIVAGELNRFDNDGTEIEMKVKRLILHPNYTGKPHYRNDIALLKLEKFVKTNDYIQIASLPKSETNYGKVQSGGWGLTKGNTNPNTLIIAHLKIMPRSQCRKYWGRYITNKVICVAGEKDKNGTCQGDSGGGLMKKDHAGNYVVIGVTSFGEESESGYKCDLTIPGVFTNVIAYMPWIKKSMNKFP